MGGVVLLAIVLTIGLTAPNAVRADNIVTRVSVGVRPANFKGKCPAHLTFIGTIVVSRQPAFVEYVWLRSDGARSAPQRIEVKGKGRGVTDTWELGAPNSRMQVWERLRVLSPNGMTSAAAVAHIDCH
jgi:hypothetical protein